MARTFNLTLTGAQEAPTPVASGAIGTGTVLWDEAAGTAAYTFTVAGLDFGPVLGLTPQTASTGDDVTIMHVHNAPLGVAGPIVFGLIGPAQDTDDLSVTPSADGSWTVSGVWEASDPANVSIAAFAGALTAAFAGDEVPLYFNVHTRSFPAGEIRGQWVAGDGAGGLGHLGDFGGDGQADILWRGRAGEAVVWTMDGAQVAGAAALPNPTAYWAVA